MEQINLVELLVQAGALGALVLVLFLLAKYGSQFIQRMLDHLKAGIEAQMEVAASLKTLCESLGDCEAKIQEQGTGTAQVLADISKLLQAHEGRAQRRHEQAMEHADQRHAEMIGILKGLNGKP